MRGNQPIDQRTHGQRRILGQDQGYSRLASMTPFLLIFVVCGVVSGIGLVTHNLSNVRGSSFVASTGIASPGASATSVAAPSNTTIGTATNPATANPITRHGAPTATSRPRPSATPWATATQTVLVVTFTAADCANGNAGTVAVRTSPGVTLMITVTEDGVPDPAPELQGSVIADSGGAYTWNWTVTNFTAPIEAVVNAMLGTQQSSGNMLVDGCSAG